MYENFTEQASRGPITETGPDGRTVILGKDAWRELLVAITNGIEPGDPAEALAFLAWQASMEAYKGVNVSSVAGCPDCVTPQRGVKIYCDVHRCAAIRRSGKRCNKVARASGAWMFCSEHGCHALLAVPGILCAEPNVDHNHCKAHKQRRKPVPTAR